MVRFVSEARAASSAGAARALAECVSDAVRAKIDHVLVVLSVPAAWRPMQAHVESQRGSGSVEVEVLGVWELRRPPGPPHEVLSRSRRDEIVRKYGADHLPRILAADPQCRWLGARAGDVVRVERRASDVGGVADHFRLVVPCSALQFSAICLKTNAGVGS